MTIWVLLGLCVLGGAGCDDAGSDGALEAAIVASTVKGNAPLEVEFSARTSGPLEAEYSYLWDFGDDAGSSSAEPTHRFDAPGEYTVTVKVDSTVGGSAEATVLVSVSPAADLRIGDVSATPLQSRAGGEMTLSWSFQNTGADAIGGWRMVAFLSTDQTWDGDDVEIFVEQRTDGAASDVATTFTEIFELPADLDSGDYFVGVIADPEAQIGDTSRMNNVAFGRLPIIVRNPSDTGPDLVACGIEVPTFAGLEQGQEPTVELGEQLAAKVCFSNGGDRPIASFAYQVVLSADEVLDAGDAIIGGDAGLALGVGDREVYEVFLELPQGPAGRYFLFVVADPDDALAEQLEDNNSRRLPLGINLAEAGDVEGVDLAALEIEVDGDRFYWGQSITGTLQIVNRGSAAVARPFVARITAQPVTGGDGVQLRSLNVAGIEAGETLSLPLILPVNRRVVRGEYTLNVVVDPTNSVDDVNPGNNSRTLRTPLDLGGEPDIDLAVGAVAAAPTDIAAGESVGVAFTVSNLGMDPSGAVEGIVFIGEDAVFDRDDLVLDRFPIASLDGGEEAAMLRDVVVPATLDQQVPSWRIGVAIDPADTLRGERSEENNVSIAAAAITVTGAIGGCTEDEANEENDAPADARAIAPGVYEGLGICDDADWFAVDVAAGQRLTARIVGLDGRPTLTLADAAGVPLQQGILDETGGFGVFQPAADAQRTLLIGITGGGARFQYDLQIDLEVVDARPNLTVVALPPLPGLVQAGAPIDARLQVTNLGGGVAPASVVGIYIGRDAFDDAQLLAESAVESIEPGQTTPVLEVRVTIPVELANGRYRVFARVDNSDAIEESSEADNVAFGELRIDAEQACEADAFEPNGSEFEADGLNQVATPVVGGRYEDLFSCRGDDDWYAVALEVDERLRIAIDFDRLSGDLELALYGPDGQTVLDRSETLQGRESVELLRAREAGTYFVRVFLKADDDVNISNGYEMSVEVLQADACENDANEPNGTAETAALLPDGRHDLVLCPGEEDWFRFAIPVGNTVSFQVASGEAGARIALFDPAGELLDESARRIAHNAQVNGVYTLRVTVDADESVVYALTVLGVSGVDLAADAMRLSTAVAAPGDDLRAELRISNLRGDPVEGVLARFSISADERLSPDDVQVAERRIPVIQGAGELEIAQRISLPFNLPEGPTFVIVQIDPDRQVPDVARANNVVAAPLSIVSRCVDDDPRDNEGPGTATAIEGAEGSLEGGVICPFTEDWFSLDLDAGVTEIQLGFTHAAGDLDLQIFDLEGRPLGESRTEADTEVVVLDLADPATVRVRVDGFLDARNTYRLDWSRP